MGGNARSWQDGARILLVDVAPDLVSLVRRTFPAAEVRIAGDTELLERTLAEAWDTLLVDLDTVRLGQVLPHTERLAVIGVTSSAPRVVHHGELADVLLQPVLGEDLRRSMERLLGSTTQGSPGERRLARVHAGVRIASLAAVALGLLVTALVGSAQVLEVSLSIAAGALGVARLRWLDTDRIRVTAAVSLVLAAALLMVTGGAESPYLLYAWVAAAEAGLVLGPRAAATSAAMMVLATVPAGVLAASQPGATRAWAAVAVVLPSVTIIAWLARRLWQDDPSEPDPNLTELHRALGTVLHTAGQLPGGMAMADAAASVLDEATTNWAADGGVVLVEQHGALVEVGSTGLPAHPSQLLAAGEALVALHGDTVASGDSRSIADASLPTAYRLTPTAEAWTLTPLTHQGTAVGTLLWTSRRPLNDRRRRELRALSRRGGLAVATARRFERVRASATDDDRARLRTAIERQVFQQLLSLRYEVEGLAAASSADALRPELDRLAARTRDIAVQLRHAADQLTAQVDSLGLGAALRTHCRELLSLGVTRLELELTTQQRPGRDAEVVAYELATTAIHDAIAAGGHVSVRLLERDDVIVVEVADDGTPPPGAGVALARMGAAAAEFGIAVTRDAGTDGNAVTITTTPLRRPADRLVP